MENNNAVNQEKELVAGVEDSGSALTSSNSTISEHDSIGSEEIIEHEEHLPDYSSLSKNELLAVLKDMLKSDDYKFIDSVTKEIKPLYDELRNSERNEALIRFKSEGGNENDFEYRLDETDHSFDATLKLLRDKRNQFYRSQEEKKTENLHKKNELLEKLRVLVDGEDNPNSFQEFKELQHQWKQIGVVPNMFTKTLWANYNALIDRFYDHRSIYFELKELDRKKNLEAKVELCVKAERLLNVEKIKDAVRELNELHHEFKHIGPVPAEDQENVWQRFKKASDEVYARRDAYVAQLQTELQKNQEEKSKLTEEISPFSTFSSTRIKEWNEKTQLILDIQKRWDAIGAVPRAKAKEINKKFWSAFKLFFHNKGLFFKKLDEERSTNLKAKQELVHRANELKESEDWTKTSQELMDLQRRWKEIGPVPEKQREKIFKEFKEACDYFFEHRRGILEKADQEQVENQKKKEAIIDQLLMDTQAGTGSVENLHKLQDEFNEIGFVPKSVMASIRNRFNDAIAKYIDTIGGLNEEEKEQVSIETQLANLKNDPQAEKKLYQKEQTLRKQITKAENDLAVLRNNLEFFGRSKNADKLKEEFNGKIEEANHHLVQLKKQLKLLKSA